MIKNLLGKKQEKADPKSDAEVQKLRDKFNEIASTDAKTDKPVEKPAAATPTTIQQPGQPQQQNFEYVDPEKAEENERITNLIMQQIKELIEIDNNLNSKIKEIETKLGENATNLASTKDIVEQFNSRLELIEKNMEKFMGLYEVVTNRFNPFVSEDDAIDQPGKKEEALTQKDPEKDDATGPSLSISDEVKEIIDEAGVEQKLDTEQETIVEDELKKAIEMVGPKAADDMKDDIAKHVQDTVGQELKIAMEKHIKLSNDELKKAMGEMLLETVSHLKQEAKETATPTPPTGTQPADKEVHPDYHFYLSNGTPIKSIQGLKDALKVMDDKTFSSHVTADKNDFADWLRVVLKDNKDADLVAKAKTKEEIAAILGKI